MNQRAKNAWLLNIGLVVLFAAAALVVRTMNTPVHAAGGGWEADGMMLNTTENEAERVVLVDTLKKNIMVYKTAGSGEFRLMSARSYQFDVEMDDTSGSAEIERRNGITFSRAVDFYLEREKEKKP